MSSQFLSLSDMVSLDQSSLGSGSSTSIKRGIGLDRIRIKLETPVNFLFFASGFLSRQGSFKNFVVYDAEKNAGLFQHIVVYIFVILPLIYMQLTIGQYTQMGPIHFKHINPLMHGLGYVFIITCMIEIIQTNTYLADNLLYFLLTLQQELQWMICRGYKETCLDYKAIHSCHDCVKENTDLSAQLYWKYIYMNNSYQEIVFTFPTISKLILIALSWCVIYTILINFGKKLVKVIRTNVIILDTLMLLLLGVALCTSGSTSQLSLMFSFSLDQLLSLEMWLVVINRNIRWLSIGKGIYIMMGNFFTITSQASIISIGVAVVAFTHTFLASTIMQISFGIISSYVGLTKNNMTTLIKPTFPRPNLVILPQAFGLMAAPQLWTAGYFFVCILILLNNELIYITVVERNLTDAYPSLIRYRKYMLALLSIMFFCVTSLIMSKTMFAAVDFLHSIHFHLELLTTCIMVLCVSYFYGVQKLSDDIHFFYGSQPTIFYKVCWYALPAVLTYSFCKLFLNESLVAISYVNIVYIAEIITFILLILPIPISIIKEVYIHIKEKNMVGLFKPSERWGPADPEERHLRKIFNPREEIRSRRRYETCQHNCLLNSKVYKKIVSEEDKLRHEIYGIDITTKGN